MAIYLKVIFSPSLICLKQWRMVGAMLFIGLFTGCSSLQKNLDVTLPSYTSQLVAECYLEPGKVPRLAVTESVTYLDQNSILPSVPLGLTVTLTLPDGRTELMDFRPVRDTIVNQFYTHVGREPLVAHPGDIFKLDVLDPAGGRHLTGSATMPTTVPIDSVKYKFNDKTGTDHQAYFLAYFQDPATPNDDYRLQFHVGDPAKNSFYNDPATDMTVQDRLFNGQRITLGTSYRFHENDTVTAVLYHIDEAFYRFRRSVGDARNANGNPFAQPSAIYSTVQGGLGIFTVLNYTRVTTILRP